LEIADEFKVIHITIDQNTNKVIPSSSENTDNDVDSSKG
jgi:hypothetical protein